MSTAPDFLSDEPSSVTAEPEAQAAPDTAAPAKATKEAAPPPPPATAPAAAAEPASVDPAAHPIPLATFLDTRERLQAAEREAKELKAWKEAKEAEARRQPAPDRNANPEAFEDHRAQTMAAQMRDQTVLFSRKMAERDHGKETVEAAFTWGVQRCDADPLFNQKVAQSDDPIELVVSEWKRDQTLSKLGDGADLDAFLAWKASQTPAGQPPQQQPTQTPATRVAPAAPRASLASAPSAGTSSAPEARDGESTFGAMFGN